MRTSAFFLLLAVYCVAGLVHFHDHAVLRYEITSKSQMEVFTNLGVDVWSHDSVLVMGMNDIMVSPAQKLELTLRGIHHKEVMIADVEKHLANERESIGNLLAAPQADWFDTYHNLDEIFAYYSNLTTTFSQHAKYIPSIGKSMEGRDIPAVIVGSLNATPKKKIFFEGGQHAREWIGHATVAYITTQLLTNSTAQLLLNSIQFVIVPVVNVDGYVYTWSTNRLWRKNRRANTGGSFGVDLNRNWDDHFGGPGSSNTPTSDTYHGTAPFSEPETNAVSRFYSREGPFAGAIDYHSYGQLVLRPYGWTDALPPNDATSKLVGDGIRDSILATSGVQYTSEPSWQVQYTAGTAQDWFFAAGATPLAYTIGLRDTGTSGFVLPSAQIIPTGQENWVAFKYFADYILNN